MPTSLLEHAHAYADQFNWAVIPVKGKNPACKYRRFTATPPTKKQRGGLFSIAGLTGLAVLPGAISDGLRVRDFDTADAYDRWAAAHPDVAATLPTSRTRRGYHVYFRADLADRVTTFTDGELRAGSCIVVLPPSEHPDGGNYDWVRPPQDAIPRLDDVGQAGLLGVAPEGLPAGPTQVPFPVIEAIDKTTPTAYGQRRDMLFKFVRRLIGILDLDVSPKALEVYVRQWHTTALPYIRTKDFIRTEIDFYDAWENAHTPLTDTKFQELVERALAEPEPPWFENWAFSGYGKMLLQVCIGLQRERGEQPFFLSARTAGAILNIDHNLAHELMKKLAKAGHLKLVDKGTLKGNKASTWLCLATAG